MATSPLPLDTYIHSASEMSAAERQFLDDWFQQQFGHLPIVWATPEWYAVARTEQGIIGRLTLVQRPITVGDQPVHVGGVGGVITRPAFRGQGVATALLRHVVCFMKEELGVAFGLLLCRREVVPVYEKVGWRTVVGPTRFAQAAGPQTYPHETMIVPCLSQEWPDGPIDLCGLPW